MKRTKFLKNKVEIFAFHLIDTLQYYIVENKEFITSSLGLKYNSTKTWSN